VLTPCRRLQMARLAPSLNEDYVRDSFDDFVETQRMIDAVNSASELLHDGDKETVRSVPFHAASM